MMESITRKLNIPVKRIDAFNKFANHLDHWWPKEYTWSGSKLEHIGIDLQVDGLCSETGPYGFRCDWGRVLKFKPGELIEFTWQISPSRVPEPDPSRASLVRVVFSDDSPGETIFELEHSKFENHGKGSEEYRNAMDSDAGWDFILQRYAEYCTR